MRIVIILAALSLPLLVQAAPTGLLSGWVQSKTPLNPYPNSGSSTSGVLEIVENCGLDTTHYYMELNQGIVSMTLDHPGCEPTPMIFPITTGFQSYTVDLEELPPPEINVPISQIYSLLFLGSASIIISRLRKGRGIRFKAPVKSAARPLT